MKTMIILVGLLALFTTATQAQSKMQKKFLVTYFSFPKMSSKINNFADYDVIFVGYPNWWFDMPRVIYTLFSEYDFSGKIIVPFCTHGGSGFSQSVETIETLEKGAKVIPIPAIPQNNAARSGKGIVSWLQKQGFTK